MTLTARSLTLIGTTILAVYLFLPTSLISSTKYIHTSLGTSSSMAGAEVQVRLHAAATQIGEGEPVVVKVTMTHGLKEDLHVLSWNAPVKPGSAKYKGAMSVKDAATGADCSKGIISAKFAVPGSIPAERTELGTKAASYLDSFVVIPAGDKGATFEIDLVDGPVPPFAMVKGRTYKVETAGAFHDYYIGTLDRSSERAVPFASFEERATWKTAEPIEITIV